MGEVAPSYGAAEGHCSARVFARDSGILRCRDDSTVHILQTQMQLSIVSVDGHAM
jgi:hypothetical protein